MPTSSREVIRRLKEIGFNPVSKRGSHLKLKDTLGHVIVLPERQSRDMKMGVIWNINRTLKGWNYEQLNLWK